MYLWWSPWWSLWWSLYPHRAVAVPAIVAAAATTAAAAVAVEAAVVVVPPGAIFFRVLFNCREKADVNRHAGTSSWCWFREEYRYKQQHVEAHVAGLEYWSSTSRCTYFLKLVDLSDEEVSVATGNLGVSDVDHVLEAESVTVLNRAFKIHKLLKTSTVVRRKRNNNISPSVQ